MSPDNVSRDFQTYPLEQKHSGTISVAARDPGPPARPAPGPTAHVLRRVQSAGDCLHSIGRW